MRMDDENNEERSKMNLPQKMFILYLEARLVVGDNIDQIEFADFLNIGRQQASRHFQAWQAVSDVPFYHKNLKTWIKRTRSRSRFFRKKADAQDYIDRFEFILKFAKRKEF